MIITDIESDIRTIEENTFLDEETNFDARADAIDFIDFHIIDRIDCLLPDSELKDKLGILKNRAEVTKRKLEKIDANVFKQLRENIRNGIYNKSSLSEMVCKYIGYDVNDTDNPGQIGYDNLDTFIDRLISEAATPDATLAAEPEMVFYQKTPARIIFEVAQLAHLGYDDVLYDIGSGLGQVPILVNLICGAKTIGIEYEPAYCNYAKLCTAQLNLSDVEFINADARKGNYSSGTVFFMYTPFKGKILQEMMEILYQESRERSIRIFAYGPCSSYVARQSWVNCAKGDPNNLYDLCEFRSMGNLAAI